MPASRPRVQTLVAMKARSRASSSATRSPTTPPARPYIGELSITVPPPLNSVRRTLWSGRRWLGEGPTSNVYQVPHPTTGSISPVVGIGLFSISDILLGNCLSRRDARSRSCRSWRSVGGLTRDRLVSSPHFHSIPPGRVKGGLL